LNERERERKKEKRFSATTPRGAERSALRGRRILIIIIAKKQTE
tara:strand:- start:619 stop:750 length:132 start_codon:yes stop_codon:yes gene_type:complete